MYRLSAAVSLTLLLLLATSACASTPRDAQAGPAIDDTEVAARPRNVDPLEPINRFNYRVHRVGDRFVLRPVARAYQNVTPRPVRRGVSNFMRNLGMPIVIVNNVLQGKFSQAVDDTGRFLVNSTIGILGLVDVASKAGMDRPNEDFGQTLGVWGVSPGPYLFIPFLGPTTFRDGVGLAVDALTHPLFYYNNSSVRDKLAILAAVDARAGLLSLDGNIESAADPYLFIRDAYLQRREFLIHDGDPPQNDFYDLYDLDELDDLDDL
ncbi:MAG: VacJ family lipoprotein [Gammaproteobacteria bacterium]|nr:VacJ family lipoprotein [Gammaproteobacteria bacterium]